MAEPQKDTQAEPKKYESPRIIWEEEIELRALAFQCGKQLGEPTVECAANSGAS